MSPRPVAVPICRYHMGSGQIFISSMRSARLQPAVLAVFNLAGDPIGWRRGLLGVASPRTSPTRCLPLWPNPW